MRCKTAWWFVILVLAGGVQSAAEPNPLGLRKLMDTPIRDPSICAGPDQTYYLTGTSTPFWDDNQDSGIRVWKS